MRPSLRSILLASAAFCSLVAATVATPVAAQVTSAPSAPAPIRQQVAPRDIAYAVAYFASDASACVTGTVMDLEQYPVGAPPNW